MDSHGKATARRIGKATLVARVNGRKFKCKVTVTKRLNIKKSKNLSVLFIGNSITRRNRMHYGVPEALDSIAKANGRAIEIDRITHGSARLAYYCKSGKKYGAEYGEYYSELVSKLKEKQWDYIVLQEHARYSVSDVYNMNDAVAALKDTINYYQPDSKILLYMTHGFYDGKKTMINGVKKRYKKEIFKQYVDMAYTYVGNMNDLAIVPMGEVYYRVENKYPEIDMYIKDNKHPTHEGYYLIASLFYKEIYGQAPSVPAYDIASLVSVDVQKKFMSEIVGELAFKKDFYQKKVGSKFKIKATNEKLKTNSKVAYKSMDENIAKVTLDGNVELVGVGMTGIIATNAEGYQDICVVISMDAD